MGRREGSGAAEANGLPIAAAAATIPAVAATPGRAELSAAGLRASEKFETLFVHSSQLCTCASMMTESTGGSLFLTPVTSHLITEAGVGGPVK